MSASDAFKDGRLRDAIAEAKGAVRKNPAAVEARSFLSELLCFAGDLEGADQHLDALSEFGPEVTVGVALFRRLLRAETSRREVFDQGRAPEVVEDPSLELRKRLEALLFVREGDIGAAAQLFREAEELRAPTPAVVDGVEVDDLRDLDERTASVLELFTSAGQYYWVPFERVISLDCHPPQHARDLLWRPAEIEAEGGLDGLVYLPVVYHGSAAGADEAIALGRSSDWDEGDDQPLLALGQKIFIAGDEARTILDLTSLVRPDAGPGAKESAPA